MFHDPAHGLTNAFVAVVLVKHRYNLFASLSKWRTTVETNLEWPMTGRASCSKGRTQIDLGEYQSTPDVCHDYKKETPHTLKEYAHNKKPSLTYVTKQYIRRRGRDLPVTSGHLVSCWLYSSTMYRVLSTSAKSGDDVAARLGLKSSVWSIATASSATANASLLAFVLCSLRFRVQRTRMTA